MVGQEEKEKKVLKVFQAKSVLVVQEVWWWVLVQNNHFNRDLDQVGFSHWSQNLLIVNLWQHWIEGGRGIIGRGRKEYQYYQNYHIIKGWIHGDCLKHRKIKARDRRKQSRDV